MNLFEREMRRIAGDPEGTPLPLVVRHAKRKSHPDTGGTTAQIQRVHMLEQRLRESGRL